MQNKTGRDGSFMKKKPGFFFSLWPNKGRWGVIGKFWKRILLGPLGLPPTLINMLHLQ
jgi:hypothetical protein